MTSILDKYLNTQNLHHANFLEGDRDFLTEELRIFLEDSFGFKTVNNPDFWRAKFETFGIEEAREVKSLQLKKAFAGSKKVIVISSGFFTREAQNSLLKVFEEPAENTHFFIISESSDRLLPTFLSRLQVFKVKEGELSKEKIDFANRFLESAPALRIEMLKNIIEEKDKSSAIDLLNVIEKILREKNGSGLNKRKASVLEEIAKCRKFLEDRSPSVKIIMEHISLVI